MNTENRTQLKCKCCNEIFYPKSGHLSQSYCSKKCGYLGRKTGGKKGKEYPNTKRAPTLKCKVCENDFIDYENRTDKPKKYCSKECWNKRGLVEKKCKECDNTFSSFKSTDRKYCSKECSNNASCKRVGENASGWLGGRTSEQDLIRASNEYKNWRDSVYSSNNYECAITGAKGFLHAHHIENFSTHRDKRMDVTNGIPLLKEIHEHFHSVYGKNKNSMKQLFDYAKEYHGIDTIKINGKKVSWNDYKLQK